MSWENDQQLVRTAKDGYINLAIGEPHFLRKEFYKFYPLKYHGVSFDYPDVVPQSELLEQLRRFHPKGHIIVTNGAKQALQALMFAAKKLNYDAAVHKTPHWPSYRSLAENVGLTFRNEGLPHESSFVFETAPNNPDGRVVEGKYDVLDCAYAHSVYGYNEQLEAPTTVWSAGKMLACPGVRLGWIVTQRDDLAQICSQFVEQSTSGVSTLSQYHVWKTLLKTTDIIKTCFDEGRKTILENGRLFEQAFENVDVLQFVDGLPVTGKGMFAWFKVKNNTKFKAALRRSQILLVTGEACGMLEPGWYRMSMGHTNPTTEKALTRLITQMKGLQ